MPRAALSSRITFAALFSFLALTTLLAATRALADDTASLPRIAEVREPSSSAERSLVAAAVADLPDLVRLPATPLGQGFVAEVEPNNDSMTATPLGGDDVVARANVFPNADVDYWSFSGAAGDRVYAATMTSYSSNGSSDSFLDLLDTDGSTVLESDNDDGSFGSLSSSIAGATLPSTGTFFLRVRHNSATSQLRPYELHFRLRSGASAPVPETEPNDLGNPQVLPMGGWVSGTIDPAADNDTFTLNLNAGDTVYISLDADPERDATTWNPRVGLAAFGNPPLILVVNDASVTSPNSEAFFMTVKDTGTYTVYVDEPAGGGSATSTYHLSVSVHPSADEGMNCTTYTSTDVPQVIPTGPGMVVSSLTVPGNPRIADLDVAIQLDHANMPDLDIHLVSPAGNDNGLLTDIGNASQPGMDLVLDDEGAIPVGSYTAVSGIAFKPELSYRLDWFDGEDAGGDWSLQIRDDLANNGGNLTGWSLRICEPVPPLPCPSGSQQVVAYFSTFEADDGGFTHSGTADEWERGLPSFVPLTTCASGSNCWVTDLDNTYDASSNQDLLSPPIDLTGLMPPVTVYWAQRYHIESASFDHLSVDVQEVGGTNPTRFYEWTGATMNSSVGSPSTTIAESSGWSFLTGSADAYAGGQIELRFHLDSDSSVQLAGFAVDDVAVTGCEPFASADLAVTMDDGLTLAIPGQSTTYTIVASNSGPDGAIAATVSDPFPADCTSVSWTCAGSGGGTCSASGSGDISDTVDLPSGGSATYTAVCDITSTPSGTQLSNTATVAVGPSTIDPNPANDSATDVDDLAIFLDGFESADTSRWSFVVP